MKVDNRIEYQVGIACRGIGHVVAYDENIEIVTVKDEDDGSAWCGQADHTEPAEELESKCAIITQ
jgi:hypothetical protein